MVKGLDYSLLNKVRSEAVEEPKEEQVDELEEAFKVSECLTRYCYDDSC